MRLPHRVLFCLIVMLCISSAVQAGVPQWKIDYAASKIIFQSTVLGQPTNGTIPLWQGSVQFDPSAPEQADIDITLQMTSFTLAYARFAYNLLAGQDWFDVKQYPTAHFQSRAVQKTASDKFVAVGMLTLRGVSRLVSLPFMYREKTAIETAEIEGLLMLERLDFGIGKDAGLSGDPVGEKVKVQVRVMAERLPKT